MKFTWPTLSDFNMEFSARPWRTDEERLNFFAGDSIEATTFYTRPPPSAPTMSPSAAFPSPTTIMASLIDSSDKLFFISHDIGLGYAEWRLVRLALTDTLTQHPACLQDGRFLVDFYIPHPSDC